MARHRSGRASSATLFGESASRIVVSAAEREVNAVLARATAAGLAARVIGDTGGAVIRIAVNGREVVSMSVADAERIWATAIETRRTRKAGVA